MDGSPAYCQHNRLEFQWNLCTWSHSLVDSLGLDSKYTQIQLPTTSTLWAWVTSLVCLANWIVSSLDIWAPPYLFYLDWIPWKDGSGSLPPAPILGHLHFIWALEYLQIYPLPLALVLGCHWIRLQIYPLVAWIHYPTLSWILTSFHA